MKLKLTMKIISCLCLCGLSIALSAQSKLQTFTSPHGVFRFNYSPVLIRCTPQPDGQSRWFVPDECNSQGALCGDISGPITTIICFARPTHEHFSAAFFVAEVQPEECMEHWPNTTCKPTPIKRDDCLAGSSNWWPPDTPPGITRGQYTTIGSVRAKLFHTSDSWTSGGQSGDIYRVFHGKKCYELGINESSVSLGSFDPEEAAEIEKAAKDDDRKYGQLLPQALQSFRFLAASRP